ncbi:MAG: regulatory protein RecX [Gammaproteobacteria bacterium]|nr:regulatory protein RecX [Gammaproteobacteria bacterium]
MIQVTGHTEGHDGTTGQDEATVEAKRAKNTYRTAVGLLSRREHSYHELQHKLERKLKGEGCVSEIVTAVLDKLANEGLQSDERFTESYVRSRTMKGRGQMLIRNELQQRGVSDHLIARYLGSQDFDWVQMAAEARRKRFGDLLPEDITEKSRQTRFLQQRGFTHEQIRAVLVESSSSINN